ncbi:MAG: hypothetical protein HY834_15705 [Devosia nanyangense]|uniref:Uncharacterized protein n=1 Tax=Devosia nanyangense TaxID=1228055 RepID=A0A933L3C3_9HYPH|nr:hypothetical protein [Devosia nanyangense]
MPKGARAQRGRNRRCPGRYRRGADGAAAYQGLGQIRLLEDAGAVIPLCQTPKWATDLVTAVSAAIGDAFDIMQMVDAPVGRVDAFGVGKAPVVEADPAAGMPVAPAQ